MAQRLANANVRAIGKRDFDALESDHPYGFSDAYLLVTFGEYRFAEFERWMRGQTAAIDKGSTIYYPRDVHDFLTGARNY
jgi:hypothetical protein